MAAAAADQTQSSSWGTWEDLLLACAVKRHGLHNWDSVSTELRTKTSLLTTTAQICHQKYQDLKRRFATTNEIPCLKDLTTRVRVAELKRDLQRYDVSILALQLKVKKLEEERERSSTQQQDAAEDKPDLADFKHDGSQNEKSPAQIPEENRSGNGSNSTGSERGEKEKADPDPVGSEDGGPPEEEELGGELSSDMQSSASLERKRMRRRRVDLEGYGGDDDGIMKGKSEASDDGLLEKIRAHTESGLFARRLQEECKEYKEVIRQHVDLETIEQAKRRMMNQGQGLGASSLAFYRDLLLLLTNYIVFFPKLSHESRTAHHLRDLVLDHIDNHTTTTNKSDSHSSPKPDHIETPPHSSNNTHHHQQQLTTTTTPPPPPPPIVVCRKRNSVSTKLSSDPDVQPHTQSDDNDNDNDIISNPPPAAAVDVEASLLEKPITGTRSSRRSNSASNTRKPPVAANTSNDTTPNRKQNVNKTEEKQGITPPTTTTSNKTPQGSASDKKKSVADFLKRIKKNSPEVTKKITKGAELKKNNAASNNDVKERGKEKAAKRGVERKQQQQQGKEETSPSKRSVGRPPKRDTDHGGKEKEANPPKKRARR